MDKIITNKHVIVFTDANKHYICWMRNNLLIPHIEKLDGGQVHTCNAAEYMAILSALKANSDCSEICSDSRLAIDHLNNVIQMKQPTLRYYAKQIMDLTKDKQIIFTWVSRTQNPAGKALDKYKNKTNNKEYKRLLNKKGVIR